MITVKSREEFLKEVRKCIFIRPTCAEIGCYRGDFSEQILRELHSNLLYLVDPFRTGGRQYGKELNHIQSAYSDFRDYEFVKARFKDKKNVRIERGWSFNVVESFNDDRLDFIYHDASHLYEDIKQDLGMWLPKLTKSGLMCGHDYIDHPSFGVKQAVDEFCAEHNFEMIILNTNGGDYALRAIQ